MILFWLQAQELQCRIILPLYYFCTKASTFVYVFTLQHLSIAVSMFHISLQASIYYSYMFLPKGT